MKTNPNEPLNCNNGNGFYNDEFNHTHAGIGLTKREYFAAMALQGLVTDKDLPIENAVKISVRCADLLIEELNKDKDIKIKMNGEK